ncbi:hypothetical protein SDC9_146664 [bioreactor metagenome]|uniref:Uncharacterized protein n=1 Tax=bioreactor metagenome TaxID=1076179 RepID=A0A645EFD1_9ZZZZ
MVGATKNRLDPLHAVMLIIDPNIRNDPKNTRQEFKVVIQVHLLFAGGFPLKNSVLLAYLSHIRTVKILRTVGALRQMRTIVNIHTLCFPGSVSFRISIHSINIRLYPIDDQFNRSLEVRVAIGLIVIRRKLAGDQKHRNPSARHQNRKQRSCISKGVRTVQDNNAIIF